jgi:hypothetical protein
MRWIPVAAVLMQLACSPSFADEWRPDLIAMYESAGGQNIPNFRFDGPRGPHSAGGVCQMLTHTWERVAPTIDIDIAKFPVAGAATEFDQWRACWKLWATEGYGPWACYNAKLREALATEGYGPWTCYNGKIREALARRGMGASPARRVPSVKPTKEELPSPSDDKVSVFSTRLAANSDVYHR